GLEASEDEELDEEGAIEDEEVGETKMKNGRRNTPESKEKHEEIQRILGEVFKREQFPTTEEKIRLAAQLQISPRRVQVWFQNRRAELRRLKKTGKRSVSKKK